MRQPPTCPDRALVAGLLPGRLLALALLLAALLPLAGPAAPARAQPGDLQPTLATLLATVAAPPYLDLTSGLGNAAVDHFYLLRARCGSSAASSNRVGEFDFALVAGAP